MDPAKFWRSISRLKGEQRKRKVALKDQNGKALEDHKEVEKFFRKRWSKVFKITEEEDLYFDEDHENEIKEGLANSSSVGFRNPISNS